MASIGIDCDVALFHAEVNGGEPVGFLLESKDRYGPGVAVHWEAYLQPDGCMSDVRHLWFTVQLSDDLLNPDGSRHAAGETEMYTRLVEIVMKHSGIGLITRTGALTGLKSSGHVMIQNTYTGSATVTVQLTTHSPYLLPADPARYRESAWVDGDAYAGTMSWGNSYWRA
jgi:hypothetical protein